MTGMGQKSTKTLRAFPQMFGLPSPVMVVVLPQWLTIILSIIIGLILITQHL